MSILSHLLEALVAEGAAALVTLADVAGSSPRDAGARMVVRPSGGFHGTIGGGALEWRAIEDAHAALARGRGVVDTFAQSLGPDLGQCCGGRVRVDIETFDAGDIDAIKARLMSEPDVATRLLLFGAGHVGRALVLALAPLPFATRWIDSRDDIFPAAVPANVTPVHSANPVAEIDAAPPNAFVLVMTHSHPLDLEIVAGALSSRRFAFVGLIGSDTKRARFVSQMLAMGIDQDTIDALTCPIGIADIDDKSPAVIAASTVAQLLLARERVQ
jgi:xanthine dehydrogenase accessory factor